MSVDTDPRQGVDSGRRAWPHETAEWVNDVRHARACCTAERSGSIPRSVARHGACSLETPAVAILPGLAENGDRQLISPDLMNLFGDRIFRSALNHSRQVASRWRWHHVRASKRFSCPCDPWFQASNDPGSVPLWSQISTAPVPDCWRSKILSPTSPSPPHLVFFSRSVDCLQTVGAGQLDIEAIWY